MIETGGLRSARNIIAPTLLTQVPRSAKVWTEEIFGPVAVLLPFDHWEEAIREVNSSRYGLMAGCIPLTSSALFRLPVNLRPAV